MADPDQLLADRRDIPIQDSILISSIGGNDLGICLFTESQFVLLAEQHEFSFLSDRVHRAAQADCN